MRDFDLLQEYALQGSDAAFTTLVNRYANLVYSAALRQASDWHAAEDIAQAVFIILARKATALGPETVLSGWLLRTTRFVSLNARRREARRRNLEEQALSDPTSEFDAAWKQISRVVDEALVTLGDKDRDAVALRFFEQKSFREIGQILDTSEDGAQKRVFRALEKLRACLRKQGVALPAPLVVGAISTRSVQAAPSHLASTLAGAALGGGTAGSSSTQLANDVYRIIEAARNRSIALRWAVLSLTVLLGISAARTWLSGSGRRAIVPAPVSVAQVTAPPVAIPPLVPAPQLNAQQLRLRVVDAGTIAPIANARLTEIWDSGAPFSETNILSTDQQGESSISFNPTTQQLWSLRVEILRDGYVPKFVNWAAARGDLLEEIPTQYTTRLERGTLAGGLVINENGESIPDVKVVIAAPQSYALVQIAAAREGLAINHSEVADMQGRWLCNRLPANLQALSFTAVHPEYQAVTYHAAVLGASPDAAGNRLTESDFRSQLATMVLKRGYRVSGLVADQDGNPISGAKVTRNRAWEDPLACATPGSDGQFRFADLGPEQLILTVEARGFLAADQTIDPPNQLEGLRFSLEKAHLLRVRVVNEAGHPVSNASVMANSADFSGGRFFWRAFTDPTGKAEWPSAPSEARYVVTAQGFKSSRLELASDGIEHVITLQGAPLKRSFRISGTVINSRTRAPIDQFEVWSALSIQQKYSSGMLNEVGFAPELKTTGQKGKFAFLAVDMVSDPVTAHEVEIKAAGYVPARQSIRGPLTDDCALDFEIGAIDALEGTVEAADGKPVVGAVVMLCGDRGNVPGMNGDWAGAYMSAPGQLDLRLSGASHAETDSEGRFKIQSSTPTGMLIAAHKLGFAELKTDNSGGTMDVHLQPWGSVEGVLRIGRLPGANKAVTLHKVLEFGAPLWLQAHLSAVTDSEGRFAIQGVPPGLWDASPHNLKIQVRPGETNRLTLGGTGRKVTGRITGGDPGQAYDKRGYTVGLVTKSAAEPAPLRKQFASFDEYSRAKSGWLAREITYSYSEAGREALRQSRAYSPQLQPDGSFVIDEVLPGDYVLSITGDPIKYDPLSRDALENVRKEVVVPETSDSDASSLDIGTLDVTADVK